MSPRKVIFMHTLHAHITRSLAAREAQHLRRHLHTLDRSSATTISVAGQSLLSMASNNYLGLANHPDVVHAAQQALLEWGVGAGASRLISGSSTCHHRLETALAQFKRMEASLVFSSGYMTNVGMIPALIDRHGLILADRLCHASLLDGCRLAKTPLRVFHHNDMDHLRRLLAKYTAKRPVLVVTEGVFSMDGDLAPLPELLELVAQYDATLYLDDAHGTGVMGPHGRGTLEHYQADRGNASTWAQDALVQMGTLSKAIGVSGGYIVGSRNLIEYALNAARSFVYSTALPPALAAAAYTALSLLEMEPARRARLWANREYLFAELTALGFHLPPTQSPILPIVVHTPEQAIRLAQELFKRGIFAPAIRPPTVPKHQCRLRLTVTADHTSEQLQYVVQALKDAGEALRLL
ncbi:MAG: 8-amino-7-oxononanoate synthase [Nitrospirae bacterium]|nr:MAG: 8-amino-7-oxononanoate synthase [Nitrospirota bacterium]